MMEDIEKLLQLYANPVILLVQWLKQIPEKKTQ